MDNVRLKPRDKSGEVKRGQRKGKGRDSGTNCGFVRADL